MIDPLERYLRSRSEPVSAVELAQNALKIPAVQPEQARQLVASILSNDARFVETHPGIWQLADTRIEMLVCLLQLYPFQTQHFSHLLTLRLQNWPGDSTPEVYYTKNLSAPEWAALGKTIAAKLDSTIVVFNGSGNQRTRLSEWIGESAGARLAFPLLVRLALHENLLAKSEATLHIPDIDSHEPGVLFEDFADRWRTFATNVGAELPALLTKACQPMPKFDFNNKGFTAEALTRLPQQPGVYIMRAENRKVLYVGKAANLHRRVNSYFRRPEEESEKIAAIQDRIHFLDVEPLGSELEALLREEQLIRELDPELNIQRQVQSRSARQRERFPRILILPHADPSRRNVVLLNPGDTFILTEEKSAT